SSTPSAEKETVASRQPTWRCTTRRRTLGQSERECRPDARISLRHVAPMVRSMPSEGGGSGGLLAALLNCQAWTCTTRGQTSGAAAPSTAAGSTPPLWTLARTRRGPQMRPELIAITLLWATPESGIPKHQQPECLSSDGGSANDGSVD